MLANMVSTVNLCGKEQHKCAVGQTGRRALQTNAARTKSHQFSKRRLGGHSGSGALAALAIAVGLASCSTVPVTEAPTTDLPLAGGSSLTEVPTNTRSEQLVGRWGVASYRQEKDRARVQAQARAQCKQALVIEKGPTGGVMMYVADDTKLYELRIKGGSDGKTYLGFESPPGDWQDREIVTISDKEMVMRFVDADANNRYGTFIYVRC